MRVLSRFLMSAFDSSHFPAPSLPEVAFLGRSNVGKSSVINSLLGAKIAKTSSTPGRTRSINFFEVRWPGKPKPELIFADLPGYGYAKVSREVSEQWPSFIEPYLKERSSLALCLALVDVNVPPQASDQQLLERPSVGHRGHEKRSAVGKSVRECGADHGTGTPSSAYCSLLCQDGDRPGRALAADTGVPRGPSFRLNILVVVIMKFF